MMPFPARRLKINDMSSAVVEQCEQSNRLLPHQIEALTSVCSWFEKQSGNDIALVCMPTGSGKTGIIACLPYYLANIRVSGQPLYLFDKPVLVVAPDVAIRNQLVDELTLLSPTKPFLMRTNIVPEDRHDILPTAMTINSTAELRNQQNIESNELVITNVQKFAGQDWADDLDSNLFRLLIVDEAHHHPAATWRRIVDKFGHSECPVVFLTATPFRTDGQRVLGQQEGGIVYRLSLNDAVQRGIIRESRIFEQVDEVVEVEFQNPAAYSEEYKRSAGKMAAVLAKVKDLLDVKRETFCDAPHMAIAICNDTEQANLLLELWKSSYDDEPAECYYSDKQKNEKALIMEKLKGNKLSLVIVVATLLEGFDHPPISIAAITCKIRSPVRFAQFVGRAQRIYRRRGYSEPQELRADIVTHKDYEQRRNFDQFINEALIDDV